MCLWYVGSSNSTKPLFLGPKNGTVQAPLSIPWNENEPVRLDLSTQWRLEGSLSRGFMFVWVGYSGLNFLDFSHILSAPWSWKSNVWGVYPCFLISKMGIKIGLTSLCWVRIKWENAYKVPSSITGPGWILDNGDDDLDGKAELGENSCSITISGIDWQVLRIKRTNWIRVWLYHQDLRHN